MFALNITGSESVEMVERRNPRIVDDHEAIVRVTTTAIGPRDLARYAGNHLPDGTIPGAEFCGLVDEVGGEVSAVDLGDLVTAIGVFDSSDDRRALGWNGLDGGQALYVRVPNANNTLLKVPTAGIEERALLLGDTYGLGASAAATAMAYGDGPVCLIGCDPYGASALMALRSAGVEHVIAVDSEERRRGLAMRLGAIPFDASADDVYDIVVEETGGDGPTTVILGAGVSPEHVELGVRLVRDSGVVVLTEPALPGWPGPEPVNDRDITIVATSPPSRVDVARSMLDLWGGPLDLEMLVSHVMPINDAERGYAQLHAHERGAHKILLKM